jgi:hypothetical protein
MKSGSTREKRTVIRDDDDDDNTCNITHNTESTAVGNLKPERWGSQLVQEKYQGEKASDKRNNSIQYSLIHVPA